MPFSATLNLEQLRLVLDAVPVPIFVKDRAHLFVGMNKACEEQWGIPFEKLEGTDGSAFFPPDQMAFFLRKDREVIAGGKELDFEQDIWNHKLQQNRVGHAFKSPISAGGQELLLCVVVDITAYKDAVESLRLSEDKLSSLYKMAPLGIALTDMAGRYVEFNDAFGRISGYTREELADLDYWKLTPPEYAAQEAAQLESMSNTGRYGPYEKEYIRKDGTRVPLRLNGMLVTGIDGKPYIWSIVEDISAQKKVEERLRQSQKLEAVGQLTAGIAHDFNNLLTVILGNLEQVAKEAMSEAGGQRLSQAISAAGRAAALTQQLLTFGRKQALAPTVIDLAAEVRNVAAMLRRTLPEAITLDVIAPEKPVAVWLDRNQLGSALINLALNARDAMPNGGQMHMTVEEVDLDKSVDDMLAPGRYAAVTVTDTGCGMPPDVVSKAFDPFFTTKESGRGSGLGLSMVYGFAHQSHGHALLRSDVGKGTSVQLLFPHSDAPIAPAAEAPVPAVVSTMPRSVLLVEDMVDVGFVISEQLTGLGLVVTTVPNAKAALAALSEHTFDMMLADRGLPGDMSGLELAQAAAVMRPALRIVLMSGYNSPDETPAAKTSAPPWPSLQKPFTLNALAQVIAQVFGPRA